MSLLNNDEKEKLTISNITKDSIEKTYKHENLSQITESSTKIENSNLKDQDILKDDETTALIPISSEKENFDKIPLSILIYYSLPSFGKMSCFICHFL